MSEMFNFQKELNRREFIQISALMASCPALVAARSTPEMCRLSAANPGASPAYLNMVEYYSRTTVLGPPPSQKLLEFVLHLYAPEEAEIVQFLPLIRGRTARSVSRRVKLPEEEVKIILSSLADVKRAVIAWGEPGQTRRYGLLPFVPGTMELVMMEGKDDEWHFAARLIRTDPNTTQLLLRATIYKSTGTLWLDDFTLIEVGAARYTDVKGTTAKQDDSVAFSAELPGNKLKLRATLSPRPHCIQIDSELEDTSGEDRAIVVSFCLPFDAQGWTWLRSRLVPCPYRFLRARYLCS